MKNNGTTDTPETFDFIVFMWTIVVLLMNVMDRPVVWKRSDPFDATLVLALRNVQIERACSHRGAKSGEIINAKHIADDLPSI